MIEATTIYERFPVLTPDQAADVLCEAIVHRPRRVSPPFGQLAAFADAMSPAIMDRVRNQAFSSSTTRPRRVARRIPARRRVAAGAGVRRGDARRALVGQMEIVRREHREAFDHGGRLHRSASSRDPIRLSADQSLAEATVPPGGATIAHLHRRSEEIYLFTDGSGRRALATRSARAAPGTAW